jgi:hypothetical protein
MKMAVFFLSMAVTLLTGCSDLSLSHCTGIAGSKERFDCEAKFQREFDAFNKKQKGESITIKGEAKEDDALCYKNPRAGEKGCTTNEPTGK